MPTEIELLAGDPEDLVYRIVNYLLLARAPDSPTLALLAAAPRADV